MIEAVSSTSSSLDRFYDILTYSERWSFDVECDAVVKYAKAVSETLGGCIRFEEFVGWGEIYSGREEGGKGRWAG